MPLIGTAGHVDHGKSSLIQALTGRDPDRWEEEKRRGLTIDLGFAWTTLSDGLEVSFVDVPGHERYLKNMLAGIEVIDAALFVVAADEGWMPQSEEHLAVLHLLGIERGVVALTKVDLVDAEMVELASLEVMEALVGTTLEGAEVIPVSGRTGEGLDRMRRALTVLVSDLKTAGQRPRLWVDRSFSVAGAGTVVTGTLIEGPLSQGDRVEIYPGGSTARVRGLQSHETDLERAEPGRRLAINLSGLERDQVPRGSMVGLPGQWELTRRFTARLQAARYLDELPDRLSLHIHIGSGAHPVRIRRIEGDLALLEMPEPLPLRCGDRFILRDTGRRLVIAGGRLLDPDPGPARTAISRSRGIDPSAPPDAIATALLRVRGADRLDRLSAHSGGGTPVEMVRVGSSALTEDRMAGLVSEAEIEVERHHRLHPLREGMPLATMADRLGVELEVAERVVEQSTGLGRSGPDVARTGHRTEMTPAQEDEWRRVEEKVGEDLAVPTVEQLGLDPELLHLLIRTGRLIRVSPQLVFLPGQIDRIRDLLGGMDEEFTVAQFRDRTGLSRKYAVPLLEWCDQEGLTVRRGDLRRRR